MTPVSRLSPAAPSRSSALAARASSTAQALVAGGARVNVWDDNEHAREKARAAGLQDRKSGERRLARLSRPSSFRPACR